MEPGTLPSGRFSGRHFDSVTSTNDVIRDLARQKPGHDVYVTAAQQTAGRGRRGNKWASPAGNLYASFLLHPTCDVRFLPELSFVAAVAVADTLADILPDDCLIACKWPNDILVDRAKICGILLETEHVARNTLAVIIGIGINVEHYPSDTPYGATCVMEKGGSTDAANLGARLAENLSACCIAWERFGFTPIRNRWRDRAHGLGQPLVARLANGDLAGTFRDLDEDGALLLDTPDGQTHRVTAGEVYQPATSGRGD